MWETEVNERIELLCMINWKQSVLINIQLIFINDGFSLGFVGFRSAITTNSKVLTGPSKLRRQPKIRWSDFLSLICLAMCVSLLKWNSSAANGMMLSSRLLGYSKRVDVQCYCHERWLDFNLYISAFQTHGLLPNTRGSHHGDWIVLNHDISQSTKALCLLMRTQNTPLQFPVGWLLCQMGSKGVILHTLL